MPTSDPFHTQVVRRPFVRRLVAVAAVGALCWSATPAVAAAPAASMSAEQIRVITDGESVSANTSKVLELSDGSAIELRILSDFAPQIRHRVAGTWDEWAPLVPGEELSCMSIVEAVRGTAVALSASCQPGSQGYDYDGDATRALALYAPDGQSWTTSDALGWSLGVPVLSANGKRAVWAGVEGEYLTRELTGALTLRRMATRNRLSESNDVSAVISDSGQVDYAYPGIVNSACAVLIARRTGDGPITRQRLRPGTECAESRPSFSGLNTILWGQGVENRAVLKRRSRTAAWRITTPAAISRPGLQRYRTATFAHTTTGPVRVLGQRGRRVFTQRYRATAQRWSAARLLRRLPSADCTWDVPLATPFSDVAPGIYAGLLSCWPSVGKPDRIAFVSTTGKRWFTPSVGEARLAFDGQQRFAALAQRNTTVIFSRTAGRVVLPYGVRGVCDAVMPIGPRAAVAAVATDDTRWPKQVVQSGPKGWRTLQMVDGWPAGRCREAQVYRGTPYFGLLGGSSAINASFYKTAGRWGLTILP